MCLLALALELELENRRALRLRDVGQERVRRAAHDGVRVRLRRAAQLPGQIPAAAIIQLFAQTDRDHGPAGCEGGLVNGCGQDDDAANIIAVIHRVENIVVKAFKLAGLHALHELFT